MFQMRSPFAPEFNFVVKHAFTYQAKAYEPGEDFDKTGVDPRLLKMLYEQHKIDSVIPSILIAEPAKPVVSQAKAAKAINAAKAKPLKVMEGEPKKAKQYTLNNNFGVLAIMDGDTVVRKCTSMEEAQAAMAELTKE